MRTLLMLPLLLVLAFAVDAETVDVLAALADADGWQAESVLVSHGWTFPGCGG